MLQIPALSFLFLSAAGCAAGGGEGQRRWTRAAAAAAAALAFAAWVPRALAKGHPARAVALFPAEDGAFGDLAYQSLGAGHWSEADRLWAEAARRAPFDAVYPWRRAQIAAARGQWEEAQTLAQAATQLEPGFSNARLLRVEALARLGRLGEARAEMDEALRWTREPRDRPAPSGYSATVSALDAKEFARVRALLKGVRS
jgi:predicted Zn-dependent protease